MSYILDNFKDQFLFRDSSTICHNISGHISMGEISHTYRCFICKDVALNQLQGIAITENRMSPKAQPTLHLSYLAANPANLHSQYNLSEANRVQGVGTTLINHLKAVCKREKRSKITVSSIQKSIPFYEKVGFIPVELQNPNKDMLYLNIEEEGLGPSLRKFAHF